MQELERKREMSKATGGIEVICGGRDATKEELKDWQQVEEMIKEKEKAKESLRLAAGSHEDVSGGTLKGENA